MLRHRGDSSNYLDGQGLDTVGRGILLLFIGSGYDSSYFCVRRTLLDLTGVCSYIGKSWFLSKSGILLFSRIDKIGRFWSSKSGIFLFLRLKLFLNRGFAFDGTDNLGLSFLTYL